MFQLTVCAALLRVTSRGFRAWRNRPVSKRQRYDMVLLAHIREQHHLSLGQLWSAHE